jgi:membrane-associated phospholipid phosphatase
MHVRRYTSSWLGQVWVVVTLLALLAMPSASVMAQDTDTVPDAGGKLSRPRQSQIEPGAGEWRTWVLANGAQLRPAAPPEMRATREEIRQLRLLAEQRDAATLDRIAHWTTGAPVYRWHEMFVSEALDRPLNTLLAARALALLHAGMYDATIAAWDAKYTYDRRRPSQVDVRLTTVITNPASPSYPSEHAVVAGAASEILAYLFPNKADFYRNQAVEAGNAVLSAGIQYPSDVELGLDLGRQVAALVIERGMTDGSDTPWDGVIPVGPDKWTGTNPALPTAGKWQTWVLPAGDALRPAPPYAYDGPEMAAELAELRAYQRTPRTNLLAQFWEWGAGGGRNFWFWNDQLSRKLFEYGLMSNPPRAARAYALMNTANHDSVVACWDAKYTYWAIRPSQLDPTFQTLFAMPNHPSYPSAHSCLSGANAGVLAYLFPRDAATFHALTTEAGEARIWAGLHFRHDIVAGEAVGEGVAAQAVERAMGDGAQ